MLIEPPALDSPWERLPLTFPLAVVLCILGLLALTQLLEKGTPPAPPAPIAAEIVELPPPPASHPVTGTEHARANPLPAPSTPHPVAPTHVAPTPSSPPAPAQQSASSPPAQPSSSPTQPSSSPASTPPTSPASTSSGQGNGQREIRAARALIHPLPEIPDELRATALNETATARFHISQNGQVQVELVHATQSPRLNRLILDTLSHWKFFPAIAEGHPVDSIQDLDIHINVQ